jgi:hypothetical protein
MPKLLLRGDSTDLSWVNAVMLFPIDERLRTSAMTRMSAEASVLDLNDGQPLEVNAGTIRGLLDSPSRDEMKALKARAARAGIIAGDVLAMLYAMVISGSVREPSVKKATYAFLRWSDSGVTFRDGKPLPKSRSEVERAWASHRSVAHFWGAVSLNRELGDGNVETLFGPNWGRFLQMAAGLLNFGSGFIPRRLKPAKPTLDIAEAWTLPDSIAPDLPPTDLVPIRLLELLKGYKAPVHL